MPGTSCFCPIVSNELEKLKNIEGL
jgi:hypothetical protein